MTVEVPRRERLRAATIDEIRETGRQILVAEGEAAVTLRAVARQMGLTAPALYRYLDGHESLMIGVAVLSQQRLAAELVAARDDVPAGAPPSHRLLAASRAFRRWSTANPAEFALVFGSPQMAERCADQELDEASRAFGMLFADLVLDTLTSKGARTWHDERAPTDFAPGPADTITLLLPTLGRGGQWQFLQYWTRIYGVVAMEVFGHLSWAMEDAETVYEDTLRTLLEDLGLAEQYEPAQHPEAE